MKYKISTLGCKVNQFETQALETWLSERGFTPAPAPAAAESGRADLVIVNTCTVTSESGRKSRQLIRKLKRENPGALVAVCGCFSQLSPEEVRALGADVVHGSGEKARFLEDIEAAFARRDGFIETALCESELYLQSVFTDDPFERERFEELPSGAGTGRTRAFCKIQDGCDNFCSYCIIPYARGKVRSLPLERCLAQAKELSAKGYREIVITGIEIASFGKDLTPPVSLINAIEVIAGSVFDMRIRLGSLEPTIVTEEFCARLASAGKGKICSHFHLSLQSGSDSVLSRMNRKYDTARFLTATETLRKYFPESALTADLIVGFPGETVKEHEDTLAFIKKCAFSAMHIFPYSARPRTQAAKMEGQLTNLEKARRAASARDYADQMENEYLRRCVGKTLSVLFESDSGGFAEGRAENYTKVGVENLSLRSLNLKLRGLVKNVEILDVKGKMLVGKLV